MCLSKSRWLGSDFTMTVINLLSPVGQGLVREEMGENTKWRLWVGFSSLVLTFLLFLPVSNTLVCYVIINLNPIEYLWSMGVR